MASPETVRAAFADAAEHFVATSALIPGACWDRPALGEWSIRDLVGHTSRALLNVEVYLAKGGADVEVRGPVEYFLAALGDAADDAAVAERGRQAGAALGDEPAEAVRLMAARVVPVVERTADDTVVGTPWGGMRLIDYLPTRVFELSIHALDLAAALHLESRLPAASSMVTWELIAQLARRRGSENDVLRATTGRSPFTSTYSVLASTPSAPSDMPRDRD
jgi:Mycothiol maleylpyruvate isomerase N-terminal domain